MSVTCPKCNGRKTIPDPYSGGVGTMKCDLCNGIGQIFEKKMDPLPDDSNDGWPRSSSSTPGTAFDG